MRRSRYLGSSGGTKSRPSTSAVFRSAEPAPWAIHLPPQARRIGSSADTMPETGGTQTTRLPTYWCRYGSRLATTKNWCPLSRSRISSCRASLVHMVVLPPGGRAEPRKEPDHVHYRGPDDPPSPPARKRPAGGKP